MSVVDEVINRLIREPNGLGSNRVDIRRYGVGGAVPQTTVRAPVQRQALDRVTAQDGAPRHAGESRAADKRSGVEDSGTPGNRRETNEADDSHAAVAADAQGYASGQGHGIRDSRTQGNRREPKMRYTLGGGELGQVGVTPVEMAGYAQSAAGVRGRLVAAIEDYVSESLTRHTAGLLRQGILPR